MEVGIVFDSVMSHYKLTSMWHERWNYLFMLLNIHCMNCTVCAFCFEWDGQSVNWFGCHIIVGCVFIIFFGNKGFIDFFFLKKGN